MADLAAGAEGPVPPVSSDMNAGDVEAVIRDNRDALLGYFQRRLSNSEDAAEAFGELLLTVWRIRRRIPRDPDGARMWLYGVARNIVRSEQRTLARRSDAVRQLREQVSVGGEIPSGEHEDLRDAIASLDEDDAELIRLIYWDGLPSHEAATILGINPSTARSRLSRLKTMLRVTIEESRTEVGEHHV